MGRTAEGANCAMQLAACTGMLARLDDPEELGVDEGEGEEEGEEDVADGVGESATGIAEEGGPTAAAVLGRAAFT